MNAGQDLCCNCIPERIHVVSGIGFHVPLLGELVRIGVPLDRACVRQQWAFGNLVPKASDAQRCSHERMSGDLDCNVKGTGALSSF